MTRQITVRLPDDLVDFVDSLVTTGAVTSRADAVARALLRERRREVALRDLAILEAHGRDDDLEALARFTAEHPIDLGA